MSARAALVRAIEVRIAVGTLLPGDRVATVKMEVSGVAVPKTRRPGVINSVGGTPRVVRTGNLVAAGTNAETRNDEIPDVSGRGMIRGGAS